MKAIISVLHAQKNCRNSLNFSRPHFSPGTVNERSKLPSPCLPKIRYCGSNFINHSPLCSPTKQTNSHRRANNNNCLDKRITSYDRNKKMVPCLTNFPVEAMPTETRSVTLPHTAAPADGNQRKNGSRPVSVYDNCCENGNNRTRQNNDTTVAGEPQVDGSPTQAFCLATTVPQNIAGQNIANKHTPTRNSLRHSRMIAMNKSGRVPRKYLPAIIRKHKLAKALLALILLVGLALCFLAMWLLLWAPNIRQRDNPHWSGIPVLLSGIVGLVLLCCCRKEYPGRKRNYFVYSIKVLSVALSTLGAATSFIACAFAILHLVSIYTMKCSPTDQLDTTCVCETSTNKNETVSGQSYHYVDLSCLEVANILTVLLMFSCGTNFIAGVLETWYVYLHWASRYVYTYSKVRTDDNNLTVLSNAR